MKEAQLVPSQGLLCAGTPGFWGVWLLQWLNLLAANVGLFIFAGQSLKLSATAALPSVALLVA